MSEWKLWSWQHILGSDGSRYISRLHLFRTPWGGAQLHWIHRPDQEPDLHNHPRAFVRIILRGGYIEKIDTGDSATSWSMTPVSVDYNRMSIMRLNYWHRISVVRPEGALSLCLVGPKRQEWGFRTADGFVPWRRYVNRVRQ